MVEIDDDGFARVAKLFKTGGRPRLEPVVIKLDVPDCPDCVALSEFWGMAGSNFPVGSIYRCDCAASPRVCASVHSSLGSSEVPPNVPTGSGQAQGGHGDQILFMLFMH